jgi:hypothetical protein
VAFVFGIALLRFVDDADQLLEQVDVRQRPSLLDEVSIVSLPRRRGPAAVGSPRLQIRIRHHARGRAASASVARDLAQDRIDQ